jgi:methionine-rich copper-binding protein CopC
MGAVDFVTMNKSVWTSPPNRGAIAEQWSGTGNYQIEMENDPLRYMFPATWSGSIDTTPGGVEVLDSYELGGTTPGNNYMIDLNVPPGADLDLWLMDFVGDDAQERGEVTWFSSTLGAGANESISFTATISGEYLLVITSEDGGTGSYIVDIYEVNTSPEISVTNPADSVTGVALDQDVVITFNEPIDTATFTYSISPDPLGWSWVWSVGDTVATGSHNPFEFSTMYTFTVLSADDLTGNPLVPGAVPNPWTWTTVPDSTSPEITVTNPVNTATGVALNQNVVITFNEAIDTGTFAYTIAPDPGGWNWIWSGGDTVVTGSHTDFAATQVYDFTVTAADDLAGNPLTAGAVPNPWNWTTGAGPDITSPEITVTNPIDTATGVALTQDIVITFSEAIDTGTFAYNIVPDPGGWSWVWSAGDTVATGSHTDFAASTGYTFTVTTADDLAGNPLAAGAVPNPWDWTTVAGPDLTPPEITVTNPINLATGVAISQDVVITFSEAIDTGTFAYTIVPDPGGWSWVWSVGDTIATGSHIDFAASTGYTFTVTAADDLAGNPLAAGAVPNPWSWTTGAGGDVIPPEITVTTPANGALGVSLTQDVIITFSEAIDTGTFSYMIIPDPGGWSWVWSAGDTVVTGSHADFAETTAYGLSVITADDLAGNPLAAGAVPNPFAWITGVAPDVTSPEITATTPINAATGVALDQDVVITFGEQIDTATFAYTCVPDPGGWSWVWSSGDTVATGTHNDLAASTFYTFTITAADDGAVPNPWNWTTMSSGGADTEKPSFSSVGFAPSTQKQGKPVNLTVEVTDNVGVVSVKIKIKDPDGNVLGNFTMSKGAGNKYYYVYNIPENAATGDYEIMAYARDAAGNIGDTSNFGDMEFTVTEAAQSPAQKGFLDEYWWLLLLIIIIVVVIIIAAVLMTRKKKPAMAPPQSPPEQGYYAPPGQQGYQQGPPPQQPPYEPPPDYQPEQPPPPPPPSY